MRKVLLLLIIKDEGQNLYYLEKNVHYTHRKKQVFDKRWHSLKVYYNDTYALSIQTECVIIYSINIYSFQIMNM